MAQLYLATPDGQTGMFPLEGSPVSLAGAAPRLVAGDIAQEPGHDVRLYPLTAEDGLGPAWCLFFRNGRRGVWINGIERTIGTYLLGDHDRVRVTGGCEVTYTAEERGLIGTFPGSARPIQCQRCHDEMETGAAAVRCPLCSSYYHYDLEQEENCCWRSSPTCAKCGQLTMMNGPLSDIPEVA